MRSDGICLRSLIPGFGRRAWLETRWATVWKTRKSCTDIVKYLVADANKMTGGMFSADLGVAAVHGFFSVHENDFPESDHFFRWRGECYRGRGREDWFAEIVV